MESSCKELVTSASGWHSYRCSRRAVTPAGYCRQHDPEMKKARDAARPPSRFRREEEARKQLDVLLASLVSTYGVAPDVVRAIERGIRWGYASWSRMPPWPIDLNEGGI